jgi:hypothetical protein
MRNFVCANDHDVHMDAKIQCMNMHIFFVNNFFKFYII